jgi:hypothetical protein
MTGTLDDRHTRYRIPAPGRMVQTPRRLAESRDVLASSRGADDARRIVRSTTLFQPGPDTTSAGW